MIRSYRETDWGDLCRIHDAARLDELRMSVGVSAFRTLAETAGSEGLFDSECAVLESKGAIVGFVAFSRDELTWLYVDPAQYRKGFGHKLLQYAIDRAGPVFKTEVLEGNDPALALYLSVGFVIKERKVGRLTGAEAFAATGFLLERIKPPSAIGPAGA